jgi:hypothetical protein
MGSAAGRWGEFYGAVVEWGAERGWADVGLTRRRGVAEKNAESTPENIKTCEHGVSGDLWGFAREFFEGGCRPRMPLERGRPVDVFHLL